MVLLRSSAEGVEVLLLHKPRKRDAWQLPQGGMEEGEDVRKAAFRELQEEAGIAQVTMLGQSREVYQYDFPASYRRFRPDNVRGQHIAFVFAAVPSSVTVTVDRKEVDNFAWVSAEHLPRYIRRPAYRDLVQHLLREAEQFFPLSPSSFPFSS